MKILQCPNIGNGGRMGNQIFTIASTIGLALRHGYEPRFPEWQYLEIFPNLPRKWFGHKIIPLSPVREGTYEYNQNIKNQLDDRINTIIRSYLQSPKYWQDYEATIRHYLTPANCNPGSKDAIAIHYRHGDYIGNPAYIVLPLDYYISGVAMHGMHLPIVARSDNPDFVRLHHGQECGSEMEDFIALAECKYHVISNSTYAWWAAYLSGGKVIAPRQWFGTLPYSTEDLLPKTWEVI